MTFPPRDARNALVDQFVHDGFLRVDDAFPAELAAAARRILWADTGCDPDDASTWTRPVIRLDQYSQPPFVAAVNSPVLHRAFDLLVGADRWLPRGTVGTFPVRFPSPLDPGDTGWHIDVSFGFDAADFLSWRANVRSKDRALSLLLLFSDVGPDDAPTRIRVGSHLQIARQLAPAGEAGLTLRELCADEWASTAHCREVAAIGAAGTAYLCHPFLVHAAQPHRGRRPRFLAQPPLAPKEPLQLERDEGDHSAVERAIRLALGRDGSSQPR